MKAMNDISKEYGTALFMLACEAGEKQSYAKILNEIKDLFTKDKIDETK